MIWALSISPPTHPPTYPPTLPGKFTNTTGSQDCQPCPAGRFASDFASDTCQLCAKGTYSTANAVICYKCPPGYYASGTGSDACSPCEFGSSNSDWGMSACNMCTAGTSAMKSRFLTAILNSSPITLSHVEAESAPSLSSPYPPLSSASTLHHPHHPTLSTAQTPTSPQQPHSLSLFNAFASDPMLTSSNEPNSPHFEDDHYGIKSCSACLPGTSSTSPSIPFHHVLLYLI